MSGIYIQDMETPDKKKTLTIFPDGRVYEHHGDRLWGRGEECIPWKAIPVPDHGRLIDADALCKAMSDYDWGQDSYWDEAAVDLVCDAPTIIPADKEAGE